MYKVTNEAIPEGSPGQSKLFEARDAAFEQFAEWVERWPDELTDLYDPQGLRIMAYDPRGILLDGEVG